MYHHEVLKNHVQYSYFSTAEEKDIFVRKVLLTFSSEITDSFKAIWLSLSRKCSNILGVCYLQVETIAKELKVSDKTVRRAINFFVERSCLAKIHTLRPKKGGTGANIYYMTPNAELQNLPNVQANVQAHMSKGEEKTKPCESKEILSKSEPNTGYSKNLDSKKELQVINVKKLTNIRNLDSSFCSRYVPEEFIQVFKRFIDDATFINEAWKCTKYLFDKYEYYIVDLDRVTYAWKETIRKHKENAVHKSLIGHFFGTLKNILVQDIEEDILSFQY